MSSMGIALPVGVQHRGSMTSAQGYNRWELAPFLKRDNGKGSTSTGLPIDRDMFGVDLNAS